MKTITLTEEQAQQIEEALKLAIRTSYSEHNNIKFEAAISIIRAERAQEQEPVAKVEVKNWGGLKVVSWVYSKLEEGIHNLYATPVRTKDLTDDEIAALWASDGFYRTPTDFARAVIAKLREKNK